MGSSSVSALHIHTDDEALADTCQICLIVKIFQSADIPDFGIEIPLFDAVYDAIEHTYSYTDASVCKGYYSTAPPSC